MKRSGQREPGIKKDGKEELSQGQDDKQLVNRHCGTGHEGFETHIHFLLLEHDLNLPAVCVISKDLSIRKVQI